MFFFLRSFLLDSVTFFIVNSFVHVLEELCCWIRSRHTCLGGLLVLLPSVTSVFVTPHPTGFFQCLHSAFLEGDLCLFDSVSAGAPPCREIFCSWPILRLRHALCLHPPVVRPLEGRCRDLPTCPHVFCVVLTADHIPSSNRVLRRVPVAGVTNVSDVDRWCYCRLGV